MRRSRLTEVLALVLMAPACAGTSYDRATTYRARDTEQGLATFYSDALAGHSTASGAPYDPHALTAAHRTLPLGSVVRVTREHDGRSVEVTVNDRGPFGDAHRVIDLSRAAAERLGMLRAGVVPVTIEVRSVGRGRRR